MVNTVCWQSDRVIRKRENTLFPYEPPQTGFMAIIFSTQVIGNCTTLRIASQTPFNGSMQTLNGNRKMYNQAMKKAIGQARKKNIRNHKIAHRIPGQALAIST